MNLRTLVRALLFPPMGILLILLPAATVFLVYAMIFMGTASVPAIVSYVFAAYTLTVWCLRVPALITFWRTFRRENKYVGRWFADTALRVNVSLYGTLIWNTAYAVFQLGLGFWHRSFWFFSMAGYYVSLAAMRYFLVRYTRRHKPGKRMREELIRYRRCGWIFLLMNLALSLMIFFMVYWNRTFHHHEITTIAMAAYTFGALALAIVNAAKYRRYHSPVYSASKAISLAAACVSMLTLESTMLTTFDNGTMSLTARRIMLGASGGAVSAIIILMALYMLVQGTKKINQLQKEEASVNGKQR